MLSSWIARLRLNKKEKIPLYVAPPQEPVVVQEPPVVTTRSQLTDMLKTTNVDGILNNPVTKMAIVPLYCSSVDNLMQEVLVPSRNRALVGVTLSHFFKDSNLTPKLALERLAGLFAAEPASNFARFDIATLIREIPSLVQD